MNPKKIAEGAMDRLCAGDPYKTSQNIAEFQFFFSELAAERLTERILTQYGLKPEWPPKDALS
jgi:hypothetical protein